MCAVIAFFALVAISSFTEARIDPCGMPIIKGNCMAYFPSWGYDKKSGKCVEFVYGGCGGNLNRFDSKEKCENACARNNRCNLPIVRGNCAAYIPSWGYDRELGRCIRFVYGGCGGNENRFESPNECENACARNNRCNLPIMRGNCAAYIPSWGYDRELGRCIRFFYGGCGGNENRFESPEECEMACDN